MSSENTKKVLSDSHRLDGTFFNPCDLLQVRRVPPTPDSHLTIIILVRTTKPDLDSYRTEMPSENNVHSDPIATIFNPNR